MTKLTITAAILSSFLAAPLAAQEAMIEDTDGNGTFSMAELAVAYPDLTDEVFVQIDTTADGEVDAAELAAAVEAGILIAN